LPIPLVVKNGTKRCAQVDRLADDGGHALGMHGAVPPVAREGAQGVDDAGDLVRGGLDLAGRLARLRRVEAPFPASVRNRCARSTKAATGLSSSGRPAARPSPLVRQRPRQRAGGTGQRA